MGLMRVIHLQSFTSNMLTLFEIAKSNVIASNFKKDAF